MKSSKKVTNLCLITFLAISQMVGLLDQKIKEVQAQPAGCGSGST